eukprot:CAMPEP_0115145898 /NCGR_PEP_ID=MMETSP0227-20121206/62391_1 /TAXON_ID=89957 /ORGANISM="Polarella glacialis, Strain CCMP 1383" /LENGTH=78 /DNA_ID=CAMNT_0002555507 /DNA_START=348 /DNA_END=584 /DNA_ORIENTATION=+
MIRSNAYSGGKPASKQQLLSKLVLTQVPLGICNISMMVEVGTQVQALVSAMTMTLFTPDQSLMYAIASRSGPVFAVAK